MKGLLSRPGLAVAILLSAAPVAAQAPVTDLGQSNLDERIAVLERMVKARANVQQRIQSQLDTMQDEVNELRGTLEQHNFQLEKILERQRELYLEIDKRMEAINALQQQIDTAALAATNVQATNAVTSASVQPTPVAVASDENGAYEQAVNLILKEKRYDDAIPAFQAFLQQYPDSSYVANAHYWLGQLLFTKQDWAQAGEQYERLIRGYPDSNKRADAIFKLGLVEQRRNNLARARQLFNQVIAEYPDSSPSKLAETRLQSLNQ